MRSNLKEDSISMIEKPELSTLMYGQLIYDKRVRNI